MNFMEAQQELAEYIKAMAASVKAYFWTLQGDGPNSLSRFLGIEEEDLKVVLRLCKIYVGDKDKFSKNNCELLVTQCETDWTTYRLQGKAVMFIRLGQGSEVVLPKEQYDAEGNRNLSYYPVEDQHVRNLRTKSQKGGLQKLLNVANCRVIPAVKECPINKTPVLEAVDHSPKSVLYAFVQELVLDAGKSGERNISPRAQRKLQRLILACVDVAAKELLYTVLEKYSVGKEMGLEELGNPKGSSLMSPERIVSEPQVLVTPSGIETIEVDGVEALQEDTITLDDDDDELTVTTAADFLSELKEEVLLQTLLHKRIYEKDDRVFQLEHKNGRRLLVVLPPDTQSVASFEQEATRTNWVNIMLNSDERVNGMLSHLAKCHPEKFHQVGKNRKLSTRTVALSTVQSIALARVGKLNDFRMKKIKSYLRHVGKVNLQLSVKEQERIDLAVGLYRTKEATFGSYLHEWASSKGKEKKPPEAIHYWNASLANEIEVEVDLYLQHLFLQNKDDSSYTMPCIDYDTNGFATKGITVLFGGDHGDKHCPISCKLNLSKPEERKTRKELSYQCPVVCFASVQCSKDAFDLMNQTVMPTIKQQLLQLQQSSLVTVFHTRNMQNCFRSFMVPSSIRPSTIAFLLKTINGDNIPCMTFAHGEEPNPIFGSIDIVDQVFHDIPFFELGAKVTVTKFNELFIGDLAFLAMLIGMNK
jgi:hypothetical protein